MLKMYIMELKTQSDLEKLVSSGYSKCSIP